MRETRGLRAVPATAAVIDSDMDTTPKERPISQIIQDILRHVGEIIRSEIRLVQTEMRQDFQDVKKAGTYLVGAGIAGMFALGFLLLAAVYGLSLVMPPWLAAISVGAVLAIAGALLLSKGLHMLNASSMKPDRTIQSMEDNLKWFKKRVE